MNSPQGAGEAPAALKEWAVTVSALEEGRQIVVMRKGGIAEETKHFNLVGPEFYLLPAYEHQRRELLKPEVHPLLDEVLRAWPGPGADQVTITSMAHAVEDILITDEGDLERIRDLHIWTDSFAQERLKWKRRDPLHLLLLRVYKLEQPAVLRMEPVFTGCKSWISLDSALLGTVEAKPVLGDQEFRQRCDELKMRLHST